MKNNNSNNENKNKNKYNNGKGKIKRFSVLCCCVVCVRVCMYLKWWFTCMCVCAKQIRFTRFFFVSFLFSMLEIENKIKVFGNFSSMGFCCLFFFLFLFLFCKEKSSWTWNNCTANEKRIFRMIQEIKMRLFINQNPF